MAEETVRTSGIKNAVFDFGEERISIWNAEGECSKDKPLFNVEVVICQEVFRSEALKGI
jgi:hypothetical protein